MPAGIELAFPARKPEKSNLAALLVALYLVLLAFFILLNAISQYDESKSELVSDSLEETFTKRIIEELDTPEWLRQPGLEVMIQNFFNEAEAVLAVIAPLKEMEIIRQKDTMTVRLPTDTLFTPLEVAIRHGQATSIDRFASVITRWTDNIRLEIEILIGTPPLNSAATTNTLAIGRAGLMAHELMRRGIASTHLNVGLDPALDGQTEITFVVREAIIPFSTLGTEEEANQPLQPERPESPPLPETTGDSLNGFGAPRREE